MKKNNKSLYQKMNDGIVKLMMFDNGKDSIKVMTLNAEPVKFPSVKILIHHNNKKSNFIGFGKGYKYFRVDGGQYIATGRDAYRIFEGGGDDLVFAKEDIDFFEHSYELVLTEVAKEVTEGEVKLIFNLTEDQKIHSQPFFKKLTGFHRVEIYSSNSNFRKISEFTVLPPSDLPQASSIGLMGVILQEEENKIGRKKGFKVTDKYLVIDFGSWTTIANIVNGDFLASKPKTIKRGITKVLRKTSTAIKNASGIEVSIPELEKCVKEKVYKIYRTDIKEPYNFKNNLDEAAQETWKQIREDLNAVYKDKSIQKVIILGGGSKIFKPYIEDMFDHVVYDTSLFHNLIGSSYCIKMDMENASKK